MPVCENVEGKFGFTPSPSYSRHSLNEYMMVGGSDFSTSPPLPEPRCSTEHCLHYDYLIQFP